MVIWLAHKDALKKLNKKNFALLCILIQIFLTSLVNSQENIPFQEINIEEREGEKWIVTY